MAQMQGHTQRASSLLPGHGPNAEFPTIRGPNTGLAMSEYAKSVPGLLYAIKQYLN